MDLFIQLAEKINQGLNHFIWGPVMLAAFLMVGLMFTVRTGFFQIRHLRLWMHYTAFQLFSNRKTRKTEDRHAISQFQSICTALAATLGTGNIAGVATAIVTGGPGAVFWMWVSAFVGMMTSYAEKSLGIKYRYRDSNGDWVGGAMIYMERGLGWRWLACFFSVCCIFASFGIGNMAQVNSIACGLESAFQVSPHLTSFFLMVFMSLVIIGGIKRIASVTEKLIPFVSIFYIFGGLLVILCNVTQVPEALSLIFREAFRPIANGGGSALGGGLLGYGMSQALRTGISRGVFSNEAGMGSSVISHSASDVKEPAIQGMWGMFEVFVDTVVVCTITALVILTSGVYDMKQTLSLSAQGLEVLSGAPLTSNAFATIIPFGDEFVALAILLFAFCTLVSWSYYGERSVAYLFGQKAVIPYKMIFILMIHIGCTSSLDFVWSISDTFNGFMAVPNLIAITLLSGQVVQLTQDYLKREKLRKSTG